MVTAQIALQHISCTDPLRKALDAAQLKGTQELAAASDDLAAAKLKGSEDLAAAQVELAAAKLKAIKDVAELDKLRQENRQLKASLQRTSAMLAGNKTYLHKQAIALSYTQSWKRQIVEDRLPAHLPKRDNFKFTRTQAQQVRDIEQVAGEEKNIYGPMLELLIKVFKYHQMGVKVFNTTTTKFLDETAPDFAFCLHEAGTAQTWAAYGVLEIKSTAEGLNSNRNLGQVANYLLRLSKYQPEREEFWGILSNVTYSTILLFQKQRNSFSKFENLAFHNTVAFILKYTAPDYRHVPQPLPFRKELEQYEQR